MDCTSCQKGTMEHIADGKIIEIAPGIWKADTMAAQIAAGFLTLFREKKESVDGECYKCSNCGVVKWHPK